MCGIIYSSQFNGVNANRRIKKLYFKQKTRGKEGFGFINIDTMAYHRAKYEDEILGLMKKNKGKTILFHHRNPTSTWNSVETAHPILADDNLYKHRYYLVHNGKINNNTELKKVHEKDFAIKYKTYYEFKYGDKSWFSFNDSESLLHELAMYIEGTKKKKKLEAYGNMAFMLLQADKDNKPLNLYFGRNYRNPLKIIHNEKELTISSEGDGELVDANKLFKFNYDTGLTTYETLDFKVAESDSTEYMGNRNYGRPENSGNVMGQKALSIIQQPSGPFGHVDSRLQSWDDDTPDSQDFFKDMDTDALVMHKDSLIADIEIGNQALAQALSRDEVSRIKEELKDLLEESNEVALELNKRTIMSGAVC